MGTKQHETEKNWTQRGEPFCSDNETDEGNSYLKLQEGWGWGGEDRQRTGLLKSETLVLDEEKLGKLLTSLWANRLGFNLEKFKLKDNVLCQEMQKDILLNN